VGFRCVLRAADPARPRCVVIGGINQTRYGKQYAVPLLGDKMVETMIARVLGNAGARARIRLTLMSLDQMRPAVALRQKTTRVGLPCVQTSIIFATSSRSLITSL
jgi:hypothetical protein